MEGQTLRVVVFKSEEWWVAVGLDHYITASARKLSDIYDNMELMVHGRAVVAHELGAPYSFETDPMPQKDFQKYLAKFESVPADQAKKVQLQIPEGIPCPVATLEFRVVDAV